MTASITKTTNRFTKKHVLHKNDVQSKIKHSVGHNLIIVNLTTKTTPNHEKIISLKIWCFVNKLEIGLLIFFSTINFIAVEPNLYFTNQIELNIQLSITQSHINSIISFLVKVMDYLNNIQSSFIILIFSMDNINKK